MCGVVVETCFQHILQEPIDQARSVFLVFWSQTIRIKIISKTSHEPLDGF